jgi:hypothetical protein
MGKILVAIAVGIVFGSIGQASTAKPSAVRPRKKAEPE